MQFSRLIVMKSATAVLIVAAVLANRSVAAVCPPAATHAGASAGEPLGTSVAIVGDVNRDGKDAPADYEFTFVETDRQDDRMDRQAQRTPA